MEFHILGPLEVQDGGRTVDLGGAKQRSLLAVLLLNANHVVSTDRLLDALWGDEAPETAGKAIQVYVSELRRLLGKARVETKAPGYLIRVEGHELDVRRCEVLLERGRGAEPDVAAATFNEALALWRGPPLAEFEYESFARGEIVRLEELRLVCLEERIAADLRRGRHAEVVGELEALVVAQPLREHLRAQLMLSLYRSGRQAEALEAYQVARSVLIEERGIEPSKTLRALEQAILRQDPALESEHSVEVGGDARPVAIAAAPAESAPTAREVRKTVTALSADVTPAGELLDPELLRRVTARSFDEMRYVLERHGGSVDIHGRGPVEAIFGVPVVHEDDAVRAVRAAAEIRERFEALNEVLTNEWPVRLALRVGVSTGEAITRGSREGEVVGHVVTVAARLQQAAHADEVLISDETYQLARDAVFVERADDRAATTTFRLLAIVPGASGRRSRFESPMIGRKRERRRLLDAFEQAVGDRSSQLFTILGAAGVGKSRLVQEFLDHVGETALVARGRCLEYGEGITYWPVVEAVRDGAALDEAESSDQGRQKLAALLAGEDDAELVAERVAEVVGLAEVAAGGEERFWSVRTLFEVLARRRPLVLVFDDIHWGEPTFLDLVEYIADWTREVPLLLVCIARPELLDTRPTWGGGRLNATAILLEPLSDSESSRLVDNLAEPGFDPETRQRVIAAAEGNPLFVEEMLALAHENESEPGEFEVPPTIRPSCPPGSTGLRATSAPCSSARPSRAKSSIRAPYANSRLRGFAGQSRPASRRSCARN